MSNDLVPGPRCSGDLDPARRIANAVEGDADDSDGDCHAGSDSGDTGDSDDVADATTAPVREGLPPSYRMRHEPHYVEALVARSSAPAVLPTAVAMMEPAPEPVPAPAPAAVPVSASADSGDSPLAASLASAAASLAEAFDAIQAALRDLPTSGRPLRDRVAIELARAEATRGRWLADAAVVMQSEPMPALDEVDLVRVLRGVIAALGPESRLSGGAAAITVPEGVCTVFGDERLLTTAVGASLAAMRAVIEDRGDARKLSVSVSPRRDGSMRTLEISQWALRLPVAAYDRFFDGDWRDHPGGAAAAMLLAAARRIALAHGGGLDLAPINGGGSCLLLSVPAAN